MRNMCAFELGNDIFEDEGPAFLCLDIGHADKKCNSNCSFNINAPNRCPSLDDSLDSACTNAAARLGALLKAKAVIEDHILDISKQFGDISE